jgi:hypothetical protein
MRRLPAALILLVFLAALGAGATLCGPQRAVVESPQDCCPSQEPEASDLGCAAVCQNCAVLAAPARIAITTPAAVLTPALAESTLSGFRLPVEHVPINLG